MKPNKPDPKNAPRGPAPKPQAKPLPRTMTQQQYDDELRDDFAIAAMQGIVSSIRSEDDYQRLHMHASRDGLSVSQWIARDSYKQADAMLAERKKRR